MEQEIQKNNRLMKQASYASLTMAVSLIILKAIAFFITGSMAILSGLFDSVQDLMTSSVNMLAIRQATEPDDKHHRFGHGKAQAIGSLVQACIIFMAGTFLMIEAIKRFLNPEPLERLGWGVVVTVIAVMATLALVKFQTYVVHKTNSLSIHADKAHYTGDVMMNIGILLSMLATYYLNWLWVDSVFGIGVALYLFVVVYQVIHASCEMLMDTEMPEDFRKEIKSIAHSCAKVHLVHDLKTRRSGDRAFVQFCVHLDGNLTLLQADEITDKMENQIRKRFPNTEVIIHPEPERKNI